jgi:ABC-type oligopeptide transport system substrate-binding subunit
MSIWSASGEVIRQLFSGLVELTSQLDVVPDLAQSWQMLHGGRQYVFHLRHDAHWSDGTRVTAQDFEYAWKRLLDPTTGSRNAGLLYDVKGGAAFHRGETSDPDSIGVRAADEFTLLVELEVPTGYFLNLLADPRTYAVPRHVTEAHGAAWTELENIVTNGPFLLETWHPHESMVLTRNPRYHGRFGGNVQRVELTLSNMDWAARLSMYESDAIDMLGIHSFPPPEMHRARRRHADEYVSVPELCTYSVAFAVSKPPFDDARVRRAFVLATDREACEEAVTGEARFPATGGVIPPGMPAHSPRIGLPYDPDQACHLLAEAGCPGGRGFPAVQLLVWLTYKPLAEYLQALWRENLGVEIAWEAIEFGTYFNCIERASPHAFLWAWAADYPDPDNFLRVGLGCPDAGWRNEAYDRLVEEARRITNQGNRMNLYRQADRILVEDAAVLPLTYGRVHFLVKPWARVPWSSIGAQLWKDVIIEPH